MHLINQLLKKDHGKIRLLFKKKKPKKQVSKQKKDKEKLNLLHQLQNCKGTSKSEMAFFRYENMFFRLSSCMPPKIKSLAPVKPGDTMGFRKFHDFVLKCEASRKLQIRTHWKRQKPYVFLCQNYQVV